MVISLYTCEKGYDIIIELSCKFVILTFEHQYIIFMIFDIINNLVAQFLSQLTFSDEVHYIMILLQLHLPVLLGHEDFGRLKISPDDHREVSLFISCESHLLSISLCSYAHHDVTDDKLFACLMN